LDCNHAAALLKYCVWLASAHYCAAYQTDGILHCAAQIGTHKTKLTHLMRATAAKIMAERATPFDIIKIMGRWEWSVLTLAYIAKNPAAALPVSIGAEPSGLF
jgi:hypothetical protein